VEEFWLVNRHSPDFSEGINIRYERGAGTMGGKSAYHIGGQTEWFGGNANATGNENRDEAQVRMKHAVLSGNG